MVVRSIRSTISEMPGRLLEIFHPNGDKRESGSMHTLCVQIYVILAFAGFFPN